MLLITLLGFNLALVLLTWWLHCFLSVCFLPLPQYLFLILMAFSL